MSCCSFWNVYYWKNFIHRQRKIIRILLFGKRNWNTDRTDIAQKRQCLTVQQTLLVHSVWDRQTILPRNDEWVPCWDEIYLLLSLNSTNQSISRSKRLVMTNHIFWLLFANDLIDSSQSRRFFLYLHISLWICFCHT